MISCINNYVDKLEPKYFHAILLYVLYFRSDSSLVTQCSYELFCVQCALHRDLSSDWIQCKQLHGRARRCCLGAHEQNC